MLSHAPRITDFVSDKILLGEDSEEVDLLLLDVAYSELARLQDQKEVLESIISGGYDTTEKDLTELVEDTQITTSLSESAADLASGTLTESVYRDSIASVENRFREESSRLLASLDPGPKAGAHLVICDSDEISGKTIKRLDMRKSQLNPIMMKDLSSAASESAAVKKPLIKSIAEAMDLGLEDVATRLADMQGTTPTTIRESIVRQTTQVETPKKDGLS